MAITELQINLNADQIRSVCGELDQNLKKIERSFDVSVVVRNDGVKVIGGDRAVDKASKVILELADASARGTALTEQTVNYTVASRMDDREAGLAEIDKEVICHTVSGKPIKPKTLGQKKYVEAIRNNMICFGLGPAGTGKTYLAMAMAIQAFKDGDVSRIILTRPAIEAGEKLGFLPGDLQSKIDPYLRPLYDALYQIMGAENYLHQYEKGAIEVAPLAYMRGRTLDNAYIILDEAQNTTPAQMKMFLTRIGFGSKVIVTGDITQKDLPEGAISGLDVALKVLDGIEDIAIIRLTNKDVVRHPLVQKIVEAYEKFEKREQYKKERRQEHDRLHGVKVLKK